MLTTLWLINSLLADPQWNLYRTVFPDDANSAIVAIANARGFNACVGEALYWCDQAGGQSVCSFCFIAQPDGTIVGSYICGNPGDPMGCQPQPPCPPTPDPGDTEPPTPMPPNPEE